MIAGGIIGGVGGVGVIILGVFVTFIPLVIVGMHYDLGGDRNWEKRKQLFFAFMPIATFLKRMKFDRES